MGGLVVVAEHADTVIEFLHDFAFVFGVPRYLFPRY